MPHGLHSLRAVATASLALLWLSAPALAGDDKPVDLLRLPAAKVEQTTALGDDVRGLRALTDGDGASAATAAATETAPLDVVYGFGEATVSPERLRVVLPEGAAPDARTATVEILVSTDSPNAGFRSVRVDPLAASAKPQEFAFTPTAARWILLRFTPAPKATRVQVATVEVLGREGPPKSRYEFAESPAKAFDVLARLEKSASVKVAVSADEAALFAKAHAAPLDPAEFAEAALLASGVLDGAQRRAYLAKIDDLERKARPVVEAKGTVEEKGAELLRWLHAGPMSKGYLAHQTDLSAIFDTGRFNCVSSATLYNLLAVRFGLDARAIEVPDHAFSIVYAGTRHMDVETTNADGFNPARNPAAVEKFQKTTGFRYIPDAHRDQRREVGAAGLAAIIYYNHGVMLGEAKRYPEALLSYFRAMSLDAEFASAVKNALAVLANWSGELAKTGAYEEALNVAATGLALAPKDAALVNNHAYVWSEWAKSLISAGKRDEALAVLKRADAAIPDGRFLSMQAWVYIQPGEEQAKANRWAEALAATEPGLARLEGKPLEDLRDWRVNLQLRWIVSAIEAKKFEEAAGAIDQAVAAAPKEARFRRNAAFLAQEWMKHALKTEGAPQALQVGRALVARWPGDAEVAKTAGQHVRREAQVLAEGGKREEALAAVEAGKDLLGPKEVREVRVFVWDGWAKDLIKGGAWADAADVYVRALADVPADPLLVNNVAFLAQEWTKAAYAAGGDAEAAKVAQELAKRFPTLPAVAKTGGQQVRRVVNDLVKKGEFEAALAALDAGSGRLEKEGDAKELSFFVHDNWAKRLYSGGEWTKAADVYAKALARFPDDGRVKGNIGFLAQEWAKAAYAKEGAEKAGEALRTMLAKFPGLDDVKRSARNHVARAVAEAAEKGKYEDAIALLDASKDLLSREADSVEIARSVYDRWADAKRDAKDRQGAADVYAAALKRHPGDGHLTQNAVAFWDEWAKTFFPAKDWDAAIAVYDKALAQFPSDGVLKGNRAYAVQQKGK